MAAYGLPKDTDEQKLKRSSKIQDALKVAIDAPMECAFWRQKLCLCVERSQKLVRQYNISTQELLFWPQGCF